MTPRPSTSGVPNVNTLWARVLVDELARCGLQRVCISPGSRSTPLVVAFAAEERIDDISIIDERSAAFFALGSAQATGQPVALVCTSGTAAANYFPAVCEASRSEIPLLILSADRPPCLQDCGASQAMDQAKLYGDHVRWYHQLDQAEASADKLRYARHLACRAFGRAVGPSPGPVHINIPFRKPLEPVDVAADHRDFVDGDVAERFPLGVNGRADGAPFLDIRHGKMGAAASTIESLVTQLKSARRPLILAGADHRGRSYAPALQALAARLQVPIVAEPTSGLRFGAGQSDVVVTVGDMLFESSFYDPPMAPDLILRTGGSPLLWAAQRRIKQWEQIAQITIGETREVADPDHLVARHIAAEEASFFEACIDVFDKSPVQSVDEAWLSRHRGAQSRAIEAFGQALKRLYAEPTTEREKWAAAHVWDMLGAALPDGSGLFVSNSMPIRDVDTFMCRTDADVELYFNRGINGIDGVISTGLAVARARRDAQRGPTVLVVGDVALRHDLSALMMAMELEIDATILVIDNDGGAIFEYLPIADFGELYERHFATASRQPLDAATLGAIPVSEPRSVEQFQTVFQNSLESPGTQVLRMITDRRGDKEERQRIRHHVAAAVDQMITDRGSH